MPLALDVPITLSANPNYADNATLGPFQKLDIVLFAISAGIANVQVAKKDPAGKVQWDQAELDYQPGSWGLRNLYGIRFRSANPNTLATLSACVGFYEDDPEPFAPGLIPGVSVLTSALDFQHNDVLIGTEAAADFEDTTSLLWTLTDDPGNQRMKLSAAVVFPNPQTQTILTPANSSPYITPNNCLALLVELYAAGGGGGGVAAGAAGTNAIGQGGNGGNYVRALILGPAASYTFAVGSGGAGGVAGNNPGVAGGDAVFGTMTAKGGLGGAGGAPVAGDQVVAGNIANPASTGGTIQRSGGRSLNGFILGASNIGQGSPGGEGAGPLGPSLKAGRVTAGAGIAGDNGGGGGGGALSLNGSTAAAGGAGGDARIVITEYY